MRALFECLCVRVCISRARIEYESVSDYAAIYVRHQIHCLCSVPYSVYFKFCFLYIFHRSRFVIVVRYSTRYLQTFFFFSHFFSCAKFCCTLVKNKIRRRFFLSLRTRASSIYFQTIFFIHSRVHHPIMFMICLIWLLRIYFTLQIAYICCLRICVRVHIAYTQCRETYVIQWFHIQKKRPFASSRARFDKVLKMIITKKICIWILAWTSTFSLFSVIPKRAVISATLLQKLP